MGKVNIKSLSDGQAYCMFNCQMQYAKINRLYIYTAV